ncbi:FAD-dependent monooxygenase [Acuticoccus sp. M5D2P5]|uniref:FAD-dependent monooxygenase n=1 Tax=Acuticoccus kalidii TaxID=2910977 RepID=UPI001F2F0389|nr:FAD-dependent monooxygenase [Acuticoccus kalidii]MCF3934964.1 FAD-dependent monooxygenase [Acuticoccus kalidii]
MTTKPKVAVIGAGLGGSVAAILLQKEGYSVDVYEQSPGFSRLGAGIHLGPNVVKVLDKAGVGERLIETGVQPEAWISRMWDTGEVLCDMAIRDVSVERWGAPYLTVHRGDFHKVLVDAVAPGSIQFSKRLVGLDTKGSDINLAFMDGTSATADIVIGADGLNSCVRDVLLGAEKPRYTGVVGHRSLYPRELLTNFDMQDFTKWWAPELHVIVYYITHNRDEVYIVTGAPHPEWTSEASFLPCSKDEFVGTFAGFEPNCRHILECAPADGITKWAFFERDPLPFWSEGSVVLLGDACHPMKPHMGQGAAMAIEDAAMLVRCLKETGDDVTTAFKLYELNRHERTSRVQATSRYNTWLREETDPSWVFGYDVFGEPLRTTAAA